MRREAIVIATVITFAVQQTLGAQPPDCATPATTTTVPNAAEDDSSAVALPATVYIGAADVDWTGRDRESASPALGFEIGGLLAERTRLNFSFVRGPADILSALTVTNLYRSTVRASLTRPTWKAAAGELVTTNHLLAGPSLRADGLKLEMRRRVVADLTVARPYEFGRTSGGHIAQARIGIRIPNGTIALIGSDMNRRLDVSPIAVATATDTPTEIPNGDLAVVQRLLSRDTQLRGWGAESDLKFGSHSLAMRAGLLSVANQSGQAARGTAGELRYAFTHRKFSLNASGVHAPPSVPGMYTPGDALSAGMRVPLGRGVLGTGQVYSNVTRLLGQGQPIQAVGTLIGLEHGTKTRRFNVRYNDRDARSLGGDFAVVSRTLSGSLSLPLGPVRVDARAEAGPTRRNLRSATQQNYSLSLSADIGPHSVWASGRYDDYGFQPPRARADAGVTAEVRGVTLDLGAGYGTGQLLGNDISGWAKVEMPITRAFTLVTQVDYLQWDYSASPYVTLLLGDDPVSPWRITLGISRKFSVRLPFLRRPAAVQNRAVGDDFGSDKVLRPAQEFPPR